MSSSKRAVADTNSAKVSTPQQHKLNRPYAPSREGFMDTLQDVFFKDLSVTANENMDKKSHLATVYRVDKEAGFFDFFFGSDVVRVRARIDEPDNLHSTLRIPKNFKDEAAINLLVEFEGSIEELKGEPKLGDTIEVDFYNKNHVTKTHGNGRILKILPTSKVAGVNDTSLSDLDTGQTPNLFKPTRDECDANVKTGAATGATLVGENKAATVSERNPRKLNSPTEDSTPAIANSRKPEQQPNNNNPTPGPTANPNAKGTNAVSSGPGPFQASPGSNQVTPSQGPKKQEPCDCQITTLGELTNSPGATAPEAVRGPPEPTWDIHTDRRIKKMHPDARKKVSQFINKAAEQGIYLRVTETYRTVDRQNQLYAKGRTAPKKGRTVTKARGLPKSSIHQFGIAFDCVEVGSGRDKRTKKKFKADWATNGRTSGFSKGYPRQRWHLIGDFGKSFGFVWGGNFRGFFDGPHFEVFRARASQLRRKEARGEIVIDPRLGPNYKFPKF